MLGMEFHSNPHRCERRMGVKIKGIFLSIVIVLGLSLFGPVGMAAIEQEAQMAKAVEYFQEIAEYVVKEDARTIFQRMTPEAKKKLSEEKMAKFLRQFLDGMGNPNGISITGFDVDPKNLFYQVKGRLEYEKEDLELLVILKVKRDGFQVHYLYLGLPNSREHLEQVAQKPKKFLKDKFLWTLRNLGINSALALIDTQVRQQVGDDLIRAILASLKKTTIKSITSYSVNQGLQGKIHKFILFGEYNSTPCEVEILLKSRGKEFVVLDVNLRLLNQG